MLVFILAALCTFSAEKIYRLGARKQVFFTFGPYVLVLFYGGNAMVISALFGGWIWKALGIETLFILSAALGLCNSAYAVTIKTGKQ